MGQSKIPLLLMVSALALLLTGCAGQGTLVMKLTDQPSELNLQRVDVTISEVRVHMAGAEEAEGNETLDEAMNETGEEQSAEEAAAEGWISVVETPQTFDLIELIDVTTLLGNTTLDAGKYTQIRLKVDSATAIIDDEQVDLTIPSNVIKLNRPFDIAAGQTTTLVLDFDAQQSIHAAGPMYVMRPTIRVSQE